MPEGLGAHAATTAAAKITTNRFAPTIPRFLNSICTNALPAPRFLSPLAGGCLMLIQALGLSHELGQRAAISPRWLSTATVPADPSTTTCAPVAIRPVASGTPTTAG